SLLGRLGYLEIPIDSQDPLRLIVRGTVNGAEAKFLIDTAANRTSIDRSFAEHHKLSVETRNGKPDITVRSNSQSTSFARVTSISIGSALLKDCELVVSDTKAAIKTTDSQKTITYDGIVGHDILAPNQAVVSLTDGKLYLRPDRPNPIGEAIA